MDLDTLYKKIFPLGGVDDNNRYVDLTGDKINCVQLVEPALSISEFVLPDKDKTETDRPEKYAYRMPLISIDDHRIIQTDICAFKLDYSGFVPTLSFEFVDSTNSMLSTTVPKDGSIIKVYIGGHGDELYYKPIRQDFVLTDIRKVAGGNQNGSYNNVGGIFRYRVYGKLNVPYGYRKESWCTGNTTAMQALFNVAIWTGLGFSTNFTSSNTLDKMCWRNNETGTYFDFIEDITNHACYSPNTFFTSFIDQYYVLNFVECHSLLSHGGKKTDVPAMIYRCYPPTEFPKFDPKTDTKTTRNQIPLGERDTELDNQYQKLSYYFITNNDFFDGWTNFIEEYHEISNSGSSLSDGFKTHVTYSDSNKDGWPYTVCDFTIRPIDNLKRDPSTQKIESLQAEPTQSSYIPLNLMQMTKGDVYVKGKMGVDDMTNVESFNNFGEVDTSNMFKQYYFAEVQNRYQMKCLKKCGLKVKLQNYNPAITRFSRIWVDIYDKNMASPLVKEEINKNDVAEYITYKQEGNENILQFDDEAAKDKYGKFNRALSGWYVVTEIVLEYNPKDNNLNMNLTLNRIEYQPCFKNEYYTAQKAIDKYKEDNIIENILTSK